MSEHPPGWRPDPTGRHEQRYWDGTRWTEHVSDDGQAALDPAAAAASPAEPIADTAVAPAPARHPLIAGLLSIIAPGAGHLYVGRRPQLGYVLLAAFVAAVVVGWFVNWSVGLIVFVAAAAFALFDLRNHVDPAAAVDAGLAWRIVAIGAVATIVGLILPWYRVQAAVSFRGPIRYAASHNAFEALGLLDIVLSLVALVAIILAVIHLSQSSSSRSSLPLAGLAALAWLGVVFRMLDVPDSVDGGGFIEGIGEVDVDIGRGLGAWLGFAGTLAVAAGAYAASKRRT